MLPLVNDIRYLCLSSLLGEKKGNRKDNGYEREDTWERAGLA